jgi:4-oxalocrotonate tautomerase
VVAIAGCSESVVSVAIEEVTPQAWAEAVYRPDILAKPETLVREPGYNPFDPKD